MAYIDITPENLEAEHLCCMMNPRKGEHGLACKRAWIRARLAEGLVFRKADVRGKVFIEYIPAEAAWAPVSAPGYLLVNCFWVAGQYKRQGHGAQLLQSCVEDARAQGKAGVAAVATRKKRPFVTDGAYLKHRGFQVADTALPDFELLYLPLDEGAAPPQFRPQAKDGTIDEGGLVLYYTDQCPYASTHAQRLADYAAATGRHIALRRPHDAQAAQQCPAPYTTYALYRDGQFVTNEVLTSDRLEKILAE